MIRDRPQGGGTPPRPPEAPVEIPAHLDHGSSWVYRKYRCRCGKCQEWRRVYDRERYERQHSGPEYEERRRNS